MNQMRQVKEIFEELYEAEVAIWGDSFILNDDEKDQLILAIEHILAACPGSFEGILVTTTLAKVLEEFLVMSKDALNSEEYRDTLKALYLELQEDDDKFGDEKD